MANPRGPSATMAKNKYRDKSYDRLEIILPKGTKTKIEQAVANGYAGSKNEFVRDAIMDKLQKCK